MRPHKAHLKRRPLSMTPLIDIIFLLLLFFMLSSTFTRFAEIPLIQGGSGATAQTTPGERQVFFVRLSADNVTVFGNSADAPLLMAYLNGETATRPGLTLEEDASMLVTLDKQVSSQRFAETLARAQALPGLTVTVLR